MNKDEMLFNNLLKIINGIDWEKIINNIKDLQQQNSELKNINDKLSSALNSAEQRIDKAIKVLDNYQNNLYSIEARKTLDDDIERTSSILKNKEVK